MRTPIKDGGQSLLPLPVENTVNFQGVYNPGLLQFAFTGSSNCPAADGETDFLPILLLQSVDCIPVQKQQETRSWFAVPALLVGGALCQPARR